MVNGWLPKYKISDLDYMHGFKEKSLAVYVMVCGMSCKIGYSSNPGARCSSMQSSSISDICIFWAGRLPAAEAKKLEKACHVILKKKGCHIRREWFRITPHQAMNFVKRTAVDLGYRIVPDISFGTDR